MLNHRLELVHLLDQFFVEFLQLIALSYAILQLQGQRDNIVLLLRHHAVNVISCYLLTGLAFDLKLLVLRLQMLVDQHLLLHGALQVLILLQQLLVYGSSRNPR